MSTPHVHSLTRVGWQFENSYLQLPPAFYARQHPTAVAQPQFAMVNAPLAKSLGLDPTLLFNPENAAVLAGNVIPEGAEPIAQAYAGHQFGGFTLLGDGRAILLGEQISPDSRRVDIQLKGAGQTPYSRRGDGRAALGPMLREYVISEAMAALGIPTTRSLAVVTTGEPVYRETTLDGAVLTRVAASHIRVGTFQYAATLGNIEDLKALADYTIARHDPQLAETANPYRGFLKAVMARQAALVSQWQGVGFIHGVMNTDNMAISGETIDYGPCAFMDGYNPATVFSSIDAQGRYAYGKQPLMAQWNLARFAESLLPLLDEDADEALAFGQEVVSAFPELFKQAWLGVMRPKLGLTNTEPDDALLIDSLLALMQEHQADFTNTFRALAFTDRPDSTLFNSSGFLTWHAVWQERLARQNTPIETVYQTMQQHNPAVIARNHQVEAALAAAVEHRDYGPMHQLLAVLKTPYQEPEGDNARYRHPADPTPEPYRTFCGT